MLTDALHQAGLVALISMFMGVLPLAWGVVYAFWPNESRLALMRPLSLATIFAAITGTSTGVINTLVFVGRGDTPDVSHVTAIGLAEALVPLFFGFGCLTVAWLCVAVGLWRRP